MAVAIAALILGAAGWDSAAHAISLGEVRASISSLWRQKEHNRGEARTALSRARATREREEWAHERLERTQRLLEEASSSHANYAAQLRRTEAEIAATRADIEAIQARYQEHLTRWGERLAARQQAGEPKKLQVVLGARSLADLARATHFFETVARHDAQLQASIKADRAELDARRTSLEAQWGERQKLASATHAEKQRIAAGERAQRAAWRELNASKLELLRYAEAQQRSSTRIGTMIGELEREKAAIIARYEAQQRAEQAARRAREQALARARQSRPSQGQTRLAALPRDAHDHSHRGANERGWVLPARGHISSGFGMRLHPVLKRHKMHTGTDIAAPTGSPIRAARAGRVLWAGWQDAYGQTVIVDHGGGLSTLYAHASGISVSPGQPVSAGQKIARVGSTGWSTGAHLHFEVRRNGQPVDPTPFLRGGR